MKTIVYTLCISAITASMMFGGSNYNLSDKASRTFTNPVAGKKLIAGSKVFFTMIKPNNDVVYLGLFGGCVNGNNNEDKIIIGVCLSGPGRKMEKIKIVSENNQQAVRNKSLYALNRLSKG